MTQPVKGKPTRKHPVSTLKNVQLHDAINRLHATRQAKAAKRLVEQPSLFDTSSDTSLLPDELATTMPAAHTPQGLENAEVKIETGNAKRERSKLLPVRHIDRDFFLCDMFDYALKDDGVSMEAPIFTLATKPDLSEWHWESKDGSRALTVTPSTKGRATQFDKDVLIYVVSQMTEALNRGRDDAKNRTVHFTVYDYLVSTNKAINGRSYERLSETFGVVQNWRFCRYTDKRNSPANECGNSEKCNAALNHAENSVTPVPARRGDSPGRSSCRRSGKCSAR